MKKLIIIIAIIVSTNSAFAQETYTTQEIIELHEPQSFYLTGTDSRAYLPVEIPENTVQWFIAFTATTEEGAISPLSMVAQLTSKLDPTGIASIAADALTTPNGTAKCAIMLTDLENRRIFMDVFGEYVYYDDVSRENVTHGIIPLDGSSYNGNLQILLYNPSNFTSINISIEVTAIVEFEETDMTVWTKETRDQFFDAMYSDLIDNEYEENVAIELANCVVKKMTDEISPEEVTKMSEFELNQLQETLTNKCLENMSGGPKTETQEKAENYGSLGWKAYENGDIERGIEYSKKALTMDNTMGWVGTNLGLFYLIKGDDMTATDYYVDAISDMKKDKLNAKYQLTAAINDIREALKKYPDLKGYKEIQSLLQQELDKY